MKTLLKYIFKIVFLNLIQINIDNFKNKLEIGESHKLAQNPYLLDLFKIDF